MLHRITLRLYDDHPIDAEILDLLVDCDGPRKQELLRTYLRIGFKEMMLEEGVERPKKSSSRESVAKPRKARVKAPKVDVDAPTLEPEKAVNTKPPQIEEVSVPEEVVEKALEQEKSVVSKPVLTDLDPSLIDDDDDFDPLGQLARKFGK